MKDLGRKGIGLAMCILLISGCSMFGSKDTRVDLSYRVAEDLNPDYQDRPSPVVIRFYELRATGVFESADFFALTEQEASVLGDDLIRRDEMELIPGQTLMKPLVLDPATRYIGILASFRDIGQAKWRATLAVEPTKKIQVSAELGRLSVDLYKKK